VPQSKLQIALAEAVAALPKRSQPKPLYAALERSLGTLIGHKLFTLMIFDERKRTMQRIYSNQPKSYPVGGSKPYSASTIYDDLLIRHKPCLMRDTDAIKRGFSDHKLILSLGCGASLHLPVVYDGRALGIMNLLH
jgi:hypothetical protein